LPIPYNEEEEEEEEEEEPYKWWKLGQFNVT
jgi:hypothetical protein